MNQFTAGMALATLIYLPGVMYLLYRNHQLSKEYFTMNFSVFLTGLKILLAQNIANIAMKAITNGHVSRDDLLEEAHKDAQVILADALTPANILPGMPTGATEAPQTEAPQSNPA
jgi:hypothetical protein